MALLILKQYSKFTKNSFLVQNALPTEQESGRLRRNGDVAAGGGRYGIGDADVCAVLDAEHNLDVAADQWVNTVCAHLELIRTPQTRVYLLIWTAAAISQISSANSHLNPSCHTPNDKSRHARPIYGQIDSSRWRQIITFRKISNRRTCQ